MTKIKTEAAIAATINAIKNDGTLSDFFRAASRAEMVEFHSGLKAAVEEGEINFSEVLARVNRVLSKIRAEQAKQGLPLPSENGAKANKLTIDGLKAVNQTKGTIEKLTANKKPSKAQKEITDEAAFKAAEKDKEKFKAFLKAIQETGGGYTVEQLIEVKASIDFYLNTQRVEITQKEAA